MYGTRLFWADLEVVPEHASVGDEPVRRYPGVVARTDSGLAALYHSIFRSNTYRSNTHVVFWFGYSSDQSPMIATSKPEKVGESGGAKLVRLLSEAGDHVFTTARAREFAAEAGISEPYVVEALHRLHRAGAIRPIRRGLYEILGDYVVYQTEIAMHLVNPAAISHRTAFNRHGLTTQIPNVVFVTTTTQCSVPRNRGGRYKDHGYAHRGYVAGGIAYRITRVRPEHFFGTEPLWGDDRVLITDVERTLCDGLARPDLCGGFCEVMEGFEEAHYSLDLDQERLIGYAIRLGVPAAKRMGWALEAVGVAAELLRPLAEIPTGSYRNLDPTLPRRGRCNNRWMVRENI